MIIKEPRNSIILPFVVFMLIFCSYTGLSGCGDCSAVASVTFDIVRSTITADTLVNLIKSNTEIALIEYRSSGQTINTKIPGSRVVYDDSSTASFTAELPASDTLIILFPGIERVNIASASYMIKSLGYNSVLEYPDGVYGWITYGYEVSGGSADDQ